MALSISLSNWLIFCIALQDEKNQLLITNMWLKMVRLLFIFCSLFSCVINQSGVLTNGFHFFFSRHAILAMGVSALLSSFHANQLNYFFVLYNLLLNRCIFNVGLKFAWRLPDALSRGEGDGRKSFISRFGQKYRFTLHFHLVGIFETFP